MVLEHTLYVFNFLDRKPLQEHLNLRIPDIKEPLIQIIRARHTLIKPNPTTRFPIFITFGVDQQWHRKAHNTRVHFPSDVVYSTNDIAPLIATSNLDFAIVDLAKTVEIVCLKELVRKFSKAHT